MKDYTKLITDLRRCQFGYFLCPECSYYGQKGSWDDDDLADCDDKMHLDAAAAIEELQQIADHHEQTAKDYWKEACEYKAQLPKRGEWILQASGRDCKCSACGAYWIPFGDEYDYKFCPNCGAKMEANNG